jgi:uncharacterized protein (TIGR02145 family)/prepilin-type N-terminal cleavage/methylation domain-containing protein
MNKSKKIKSNKKGFTLIELLVVIAIIGILATIAVVALQQARQSARDSKRIADVKQIQTALELYYNYNSEYPDDINSQIADASTTYMEIVPNAPTPADGDCDSTSNQYVYAVTGTENSSYTLSFCLGSQTGDLALGSKCAIPEGILNETCEAVSFVCGDDLDHQGYSYTTIEIGDQCWFAENLKHLPEVHSNSEFKAQGDNNLPAYGVYDYDGNDITEAKAFESGGVNMYETYGVLYNWYAVDQGDLCPSGWHVPTDNEFKTLEGEVDSAYEIDSSEWNDTGWRGDDVGSKLAGNEALWDAGVLDEHANFGDSGFDALPAGNRNSSGSFSDLGSLANFWLLLDSGSIVWRRGLVSTYSSAYRSGTDQSLGFSVRCLKD